jgi:hypothetical protein
VHPTAAGSYVHTPTPLHVCMSTCLHGQRNANCVSEWVPARGLESLLRIRHKYSTYSVGPGVKGSWVCPKPSSLR